MSDARVVNLGGEEFKVRDGIALMALMRFAHIAQGGADSGEMQGLAAMYDLLESAIDEGDWGRFQDVAISTRATDKDLMLLVRKVIRGETDRPTQRPSDSSDGPTSTEPSSGGDSSSLADDVEDYLRVSRHWEEKGRPDVAYMVLMANGATPSAG